MNPVNSPDSIEVQALRIGMFVHLDIGWMAHPFPLGSFRIASADQIATIQTLGLKRVRWSPLQSDAAAADEARADEWQPSQTADFTSEDEPSGFAPSPASTGQRSAATAEDAALRLCERQFGEAAADCDRLAALASARPQLARRHAEGLCDALLDKMLGQQDMCIRLLTDTAGSNASQHALNVSIISLLMGRAFGLPKADLMDLGVGALLHDIGKAEQAHQRGRGGQGGQPSPDEHVADGVALGRAMGLSSGALLVVSQHHELADGSGYPSRFNTDRMTAAARIVSLVNRYDNLCNPERSGIAMTPHDALSLLFTQGSKFDTAILGAFIKMMGVYPPGSTVQLTDDRFAMVVAVNASRPLKPRVLLHEPAVPRAAALVADLETTPGLGIRRSMRPQQMPRQALDYLAPGQRIAHFFEPVQSGAHMPA